MGYAWRGTPLRTQPGPGEVEPGPRRDWGYSLVSVFQSVLGSRSRILSSTKSLSILSHKSVSLIVYLAKVVYI